MAELTVRGAVRIVSKIKNLWEFSKMLLHWFILILDIIHKLDMTKNKLPFVLRWSSREYTTNQILILKSKENDYPL